ncbi:MAG: hypothetical protein M3N93_09110 [Acidobacteriota bacterium]|nr:hypothetical protein [Acidobacteriota bacterium]
MIQYRRLSALLLGIWLGAGIVTDLAVTQNFQAVDRFLETPGNPVTSAQLNQIGRARERVILRRNAGEENNWIFLNWERVELTMGAALFLLLLFGDRPQKLMLGFSLALLAIVGAEHFFLTPPIAELGRTVDNLPNTDPQYKTFWTLHGLYSGLDIVKMLVTVAMAARLIVRRRPDKEHFVREYAREQAQTRG